MLSSDAKTCCLKTKTWGKIFLAIQGTLIILIIAELATPKWVYIDSLSFEGGVLQCHDGCGKDQSYQEFDDDNCTSNSDYYDQDEDYISVCDIASGLAAAGKIKVIMDCVSIGAIIIWGGTMICISKSLKLVCLNLVCAIVSMVIFIASSAIWMTSAPINFSKCGSKDGYDELIACVSHGPRLAIAIMIFFFIVAITYLCVIKQLADQIYYKQLKKNHEIGGNAQIVVGPIHNNANFPKPNYPQPVYYQHGPGQPIPGPPAYPQPVYHQAAYPQPMNPQHLYSQPMYAPTIVTQEAPPATSNSFQTSYNPNVHDGTNLKVENNDDTFIGVRKD